VRTFNNVEANTQPGGTRQVRIGFDGRSLTVPNLPGLQEFFRVQAVEAIQTPSGAQFRRVAHELFEEDLHEEDVLRAPRGLQVPLRAWLHRHGFAVKVPMRTIGLIPAVGTRKYADIVRLVAEREQGVIRNCGDFNHKVGVVRELIGAFPDKSILVVASRIKDLYRIRRQLVRASSEAALDLEVYHGHARRGRKSSIALATWDMLDRGFTERHPALPRFGS